MADGKIAALNEAKPLYRTCVDCVRRLDPCLRARTVRSVMQPSTTSTRNKLIDAAERLLFLNPGEYGRKAEDIIWRKCFYEPVQVCRQNKEKLTSSEQSWTNVLINDGLGYYHALLNRLQALDTGGRYLPALVLDFPMQPKRKVEAAVAESTAAYAWITDCAHRTLIRMGDLARYRHDFVTTARNTAVRDSATLAARYYRQAIQLSAGANGTGYNQLGTLVMATETLNRASAVDAGYYYMRSVFSDTSFEGSDGNLLQLLQKNALLQGMEDLSDAETFGMDFLHLVDVFYKDEMDYNDGARLSHICQSILRQFDLQLCATVTQNQLLDPPMLNAARLAKIVIMQLLLWKKLKDAESLKQSAATALALSFMLYIVRHVLLRIKGPGLLDSHETVVDEEDSEWGDCNGLQVEDAMMPNGLLNSSSDEAGDEMDMRALLQRRRRGSSSEEGSGEEGEDDDDDERDSQDDNNNELDKEMEGFAVQRLSPPPPGLPTTVWTDREVQSKLQWLTEIRDWLAVVKLLCDWLRCNPDLLLSVAQDSNMLWSKLVELLNLLPNEDTVREFINDEKSEISKKLRNAVSEPPYKWNQQYPLTEDLHIRGLSVVAPINATLSYGGPRFHESKIEETIVRIYVLRSFGHYLIRMNTPGLSYDHARHEFGAPRPNQPDSAMDAPLPLGERLAQLRIADELATHERDSWLPVYVVPDEAALTAKLTACMKLAAERRFVMVVPNCVIEHLDAAKKEKGAAREASRWLEQQFMAGDRHVRPQKDSETSDIADFDLELKEQSDIMSCCLALTTAPLAVNANGDNSNEVVRVVLITGQRKEGVKTLRDAVVKMGKAGIDVENISTFLRRWQEHRKQRRPD